jgi:type IV pilus assembly protein PilW
VKKSAQQKRIKNDHGFTLIELMVAMVISTIVLAGIYTTYQAQVGTYVVQKDVVEMQQNIRNAMYYMQRSVRMSGLDPQRSGLIGFVTNFDAPYNTLGATTDSTNIAFTTDANGDGNGVIDIGDSEMIAYRLNANRLQKLSFDQSAPPAASWETVAENIDALDFVYLDGSDPPGVLAPPLNAATLDQIRSVQITLVVRAGQGPSPLTDKTTDNNIYRNQQGTAIFGPAGDKFRRISLTAQANGRNLGL